MERGSTQHSGRLDEALAEEVEPLLRGGAESRAQESRLHEPPGDDEPLPDSRIAGDDGPPMPGLLDLDDIEARSMLAASLRPSAFPGGRDKLLAVAEEEHAPPDVLEALAALPARRRFVNVQQVWETLGGERERRGAAEAASEEAVAEPEIDVVVEDVRVDVEVEPVSSAAPTPQPAPVGAPRVAGTDPLWLTAARTGFGLATLPLRIGVELARAVRDRVTNR